MAGVWMALDGRAESPTQDIELVAGLIAFAGPAGLPSAFTIRRAG
jgi:hypothetical protein